ncbi:MAG: long-chain fatty acid--CoA ligase [Acidobacteria bacterium]|nr:long-chain fatty acid--CoA ligase [Acidobacteriota bacterium]
MPAGTSTNWTPVEGRDDAICRAFHRLAHRRADEPLIVGARGRVTARDIDRWASAIAARIGDARLPERSTVALAVPNGPAFLAGLVALRRLGHPVLLVDHAAPLADRGRAVSTLGAVAMVSATDGWPGAIDAVSIDATGAAAIEVPPSTAVIKLTSGSTGMPRGVAMTAEQLLADEAALASTMGFTERDRLLAMVPMSHSYGFTTLVLSALVRGLPLVVPADAGPLSPIEAARLFAATIVPTVPAYIQALLRLSTPPAWPTSVRRVITAGAVLHVAPAVAFRRRYGRPIHVFYGSSECGGICYDREGDAAERGTVGTPVDGVSVTLADADAHGEGLVTVQSPAVGLTYLPAAEARLANGQFQTSDIATWREGALALQRRADGVINVRGRKVDPGEVESVLTRLEGVDDAVVMAGDGRGPDDTIVRAFVACRTRHLDYQQVWRWCQRHLADHKVPRSIVIVEAIPRNARGKVDRVALAGLAPAGDGDQRHHA